MAFHNHVHMQLMCHYYCVISTTVAMYSNNLSTKDSQECVLRIYTHNYALLTQGSGFLGCNVHASH